MAIPVPANEVERLAVLESYDILDTPADEAFDRITRLASAILDTPIALVSLVDTERQWFKSRHGLDAEETSRDAAFCAHAIMKESVLVVPDTLDDARFAENPLVLGDPKIRFYAGAPLKAPCGSKLGTLCVIDRSPRDLDDRRRRLLEDLAAIAMDEMELRRLASTDPLTGACNRRHLMELAERDLRRARRYGYPLTVAMLDIDRFKSINDTYGHALGDAVLKDITAVCRSQSREHDVLGRYGGGEFIMILPHTDQTGAKILLDRIRRAVERIRIQAGRGRVRFTISIGASELGAEDESLDAAIDRADKALHGAKASGRNCVMLDDAA